MKHTTHLPRCTNHRGALVLGSLLAGLIAFGPMECSYAAEQDESPDNSTISQIASQDGHSDGKWLVVTPSNFFHFITNTPAIDTLIYKRTIFNRPRLFKTERELKEFVEGMESGSMSKDKGLEEMFALRHLGPTDFIFQTIHSINDVWSKGARYMTFAGRGDGLWWTLDGNGAITTDASDGIYAMQGTDNLTFPIKYRFATEVLRLGILFLDPETIREQSPRDRIDTGMKVYFEGRTSEGEATMSGYAQAEDGVIERIEYTMSKEFGGGVKGAVIEVLHDADGLKSLVIFNKLANRPQPVPYSQYEILDVKPALGPLDQYSCAVDQFLVPSDRQVLVKPNGDMLSISATGGPQRIQPFSASRGTQSVLFVAFIVAALMLPIMLAINRRWKAK